MGLSLAFLLETLFIRMSVTSVVAAILTWPFTSGRSGRTR
eukprot:Gb_34509 [translate_table: standard]